MSFTSSTMWANLQRALFGPKVTREEQGPPRPPKSVFFTTFPAERLAAALANPTAGHRTRRSSFPTRLPPGVNVVTHGRTRSVSSATPPSAPVTPPAPPPAAATERSPGVAHANIPLPLPPKHTPPLAEYLVSRPADTGADRFPHTAELVSAVLFAIVEDKEQYVLQAFATVLFRVVDDFERSLPAGAERDRVTPLVSGSKIEAVKDFFAQQEGLRVCISTGTEQLTSMRAAWGVTNVHEELEDDFGLLIPVLSWALCAAYESTFCQQLPLTREVIRMRGQLGSIIAVTYLHEITHGLIRWRLRGVTSSISEPFLTIEPEHSRRHGGEAGWELEYNLFKGILQARLRTEDVLSDARFRRIVDVWLKQSKYYDTMAPVQLIPVEHLIWFHHDVMRGTLTRDAIVRWFAVDNKKWIPHAGAVGKDHVLLRGVPAPGHQLPVPLPSGPPTFPHCGVAFNRLSEEEVKAILQYWQV
ncbi:hypothetical protein B0H13DRAFT_959758 [Mycena leptocephala]|nr:hypothetical protein B0H13DRAFT_959758 [Mycena leptocephala]